MLFGDAFYSRIQKLKNWQQQIFATAIAQHLLPNYLSLIALEKGNRKNADLLKGVVEQLWLYGFAQSSVKNWYPVKKSVKGLLLEQNEESSFGVISANTAVKAVIVAINSITEHTGKESQDASDLSVENLIDYLECTENRTFSDEEIVENEFVQNELDFQLAIVHELKAHRSDAMMNKLKQIAYNEGYSNIGIKDDSLNN